MSPELAPLILVGIFGYVACMVLAFVAPWFGFGMLITIPVVKVLLRHVAAGLLAGYTYDIAAALLALISVLAYRGRNAGQVPPVRLPGYLPLCWFMIAFLLWGGTFLGREFDWGLKKSLIFSIFNTMAIATLPLFLMQARDARIVLRVLLVSGILVGLAMPVFGRGIADWEGSRRSLGGASPLQTADLCANAIIVLIAWMVHSPTTRNVVTAGLFIPVCAAAIFLTGTRGPILGIPAILPLLFWIYRRRINFQAAFGSLIGLGVIVIGTAILLDPSRLARFTGAELSSSVMNRFGLLVQALQGFVRSPIIGHGTGSSSTLINHGVTGLEDYPHNHVLEVGYELGLLGLVPWAILMITGLRAGWNLGRPEWENTEAKLVGTPFYVGFLYHFLMTFKMGTFSASYMLYFYLTATVVLFYMRQRDYAIWHQQMLQWQYLQQQQQYLHVPPASGANPGRALQPSP